MKEWIRYTIPDAIPATFHTIILTYPTLCRKARLTKRQQ